MRVEAMEVRACSVLESLAFDGSVVQLMHCDMYA